MISAERFLSLLEEKDLLPSRVVAKLRQQVAEAKHPPKASSVARALIDKGILTPAAAKRLFESEDEIPLAMPPRGSAKTPEFSPASIMQKVAFPVEPEEELGIIPSEKPAETQPKKKSYAETDEYPSRERSATQAPAAKTAEFAPMNDSAYLLDDEMAPLDLGMAAPSAPQRASYDGVLSGPTMDAPADAGGLASGKKKGLFAFLKRDKKLTKKEDWGSVFMLAGGGGLLLLILAGVLLTWYLYRSGLEEKFQQGKDYYSAESYEQAIHTFDEFAKAFPSLPEASSARVLIGLAKMRQVEQGQDWPACLDTANTVLEQISNEDKFPEANGEIAAMLPKIAEGLAAKAKDKSSPELVAKTREALVLIDKYVPRSLSQPAKLAEIETSLGFTVRQIDRDKELEKAIAELKEAIKQNKSVEAYATRRALLKKYPDLQANAKLAATMLAISRALHASVKPVAETKAAANKEAPSPLLATVTLAQRSTKTVLEELQGRVVCVAAEGAVYGIDASSGKVLWRRFVGYPKSVQNIAPPPTPMNSEAGADLLAVDSAQNEVLRLDAVSGSLRWRYPAGEPIVPQAVPAEARLLMAAPSGKVIALDAETGDSSGYVQLPQPLRIAPAIDTVKRLVYQIAEHSNLYVVGLDDFACKQVYLLGHEAGSISSAPAVVGGYLVIGVNEGAQDSMVKLLAVDRGSAEKPEIALKLVQQIPLKGRIDITPAVDGNRVLVATDRGVVRVFDLTPTEKGTQLRTIAETAIEGGENVARFALLQGGQFWIADIQLTKFDVLGSKGRLVPKWIVDEGCAFLQPLVAAGSTVISVRRKPNLPGVFVSAVGTEDPARSWETIIAAPPASELIVNEQSKKIIVATKLGGLFMLDEASLKGQSVVDAPAVSLDSAGLKQSLSSLTPLEQGMIAISPSQGATQVNVFDPGDSQLRYRWVALSDKSACPPANLSGEMLVPTQGGAIFLLDPKSGKPIAAPFQAKLESGAVHMWQKPAPFGKQEFIIADGKNTLYHFGRIDSPTPHLAVLDQVEATSELGTPAAVVGNVAFVASSSQTLGIFELPKLKRLNDHKLSGRCSWGPTALGSRVLLATDDDQLLCFGAKGEKLWQVQLVYGPLAGRPLAVGDGYILASVNGTVWRVNAQAGKELGKVETGQALASGPTALGTHVLVAGTDGSIYEVKQP